MSRAEELLGFWFGELDGDTDDPTDKKALWWGGGPESDTEIRERLAGLADRALAGELDDWAYSSQSPAAE